MASRSVSLDEYVNWSARHIETDSDYPIAVIHVNRGRIWAQISVSTTPLRVVWRLSTDSGR